MSAITIGGDLVHYEVLGRGRPVVLVHSWLGSWRYWIPTMQQLHMKYRVYALDLFGFGDSQKADRSQGTALYSIDKQVAMLDRFMTELEIPRAAFIGHGLGAMVVAEFAFNHQRERIPRALLISTPLFDVGNLETRQPERVRPSRKRNSWRDDDPDRTMPTGSMDETMPVADAIARARIAAVAARNREMGGIPSPIPGGQQRKNAPGTNYLAQSLNTRSMMSLLERCFDRSESEFDKLRSDVQKADSKVLQASSKKFDAERLLDTVQQLEMPTVLLHGENDPLVPHPSNAVWDYVTSGDDTINISLPDVRHFPMLEHERFGRLVNDFLETPDIFTLKVKDRWRRRSR